MALLLFESFHRSILSRRRVPLWSNTDILLPRIVPRQVRVASATTVGSRVQMPPLCRVMLCYYLSRPTDRQGVVRQKKCDKSNVKALG
jgi:hypothetical protein